MMYILYVLYRGFVSLAGDASPPSNDTKPHLCVTNTSLDPIVYPLRHESCELDLDTCLQKLRIGKTKTIAYD